MAQVTFSPLIGDIRGKTGGAVFSNWKGVSYVRTRVIPANPRSTDQTAQREAMTNCLRLWQSIKSWAKDVWNDAVAGTPQSGYNRYIKDNVIHTKNDEAESISPFNALYLKSANFALAAGGAGEIDITWAARAGSGGYDYVRLFYHKKETYAWTYEGGFLESPQAHTITGLDTGEDYIVAMLNKREDLTEFSESSEDVQAAG